MVCISQGIKGKRKEKCMLLTALITNNINIKRITNNIAHGKKNQKW